MEERLRAAVAEFTRAISLKPTSADLYSDFGSQLSSLGQRRAAQHAYAHAISLVPIHAVAYNNLASLLRTSRPNEALHLFQTAHVLQPQQYERFPQMHLNLAGVLVDASRYSEALWHYARGMQYAAQRDDTLGRMLHLSQRVCDWRAVDRLWPSAHFALVERTLRRSHHRSPGARPTFSPMHALTAPLSGSELLALSMAHAAAIEVDAAARHIVHRHPRIPPPLQPWEETAVGDDDHTREQKESRPHQAARASLHLGLISADFKRHPVAILLAPALAAVRSSCRDLRVSLFALNPFPPASATSTARPAAASMDGAGDGSASLDVSWQEELRLAAHSVHLLSNRSDEEAAAVVHGSAPDILIDLHGLYSRGARPLILAARPAPVQATHLGYGASTGARFLDYVLADRFALPALRAQSRMYTERFVLLPPSHLPSGHATVYPHMRETSGGSVCCPECTARSDESDSANGSGSGLGGSGGGRCGDSSRECLLACRERGRRRFGLPPASGARRGVVYAYLGQHVKVDELTFSRWLSLLLATPRSVLWMLRWPSSSANLQLEAAAAGVDARRIVFANRLPQGEHLCAFRLADVALDSPAYASGATGIDVLWSGVPMLAMAGGMRSESGQRRADGGAGGGIGASTIFQRNGVSLLAAAALPWAVAHSSAHYVEYGLSLARDTYVNR